MIQNKRLSKVLFLMLSCVLCAHSYGGQLKQPPSPQHYQINLIIFKHSTDKALRTETWSDHILKPDLSQVTTLTIPDLLSTETLSYSLLPKDSLGLLEEAKIFEQHADYQILLHLSWRQSMTNPQWVHLQGSQSFDNHGELCEPGELTQELPHLWELNGKIKISHGRFFNVNTQLYFSFPKTMIPHVEPQSSFPLTTVSLFEKRRMNLKQLNYFDHPLFGMIVQIMPVHTIMIQ